MKSSNRQVLDNANAKYSDWLIIWQDELSDEVMKFTFDAPALAANTKGAADKAEASKD